MAAFLAGVFHPAMVPLHANAIGRTALTAFHVQPGLALRDSHVPCHRLSYQAFGLLAHSFRSEEHTSELQSHLNLVCRLLLEKKFVLITLLNFTLIILTLRVSRLLKLLLRL